MLIVIDGYNLLKTAKRPHEIGDDDRRRFIKELVQYVHYVGNRVIVVFDGGEDSRPSSLSHHRVTETYSGYKESADSVIQDLLEENAQREVLLVSTDRALNRYAESLGIPSMDSTVFYSLLHDRLRGVYNEKKYPSRKQESKIQKRDDFKSSSELDELMEVGAKKTFRKYVDQEVESGESSHRSKNDKRLMRLVKKL